jgi:colanic acid biosynthesis glycosyl transferase WcaI
MRILLWGVNYFPEELGIAPFNTGLGEYLTRAGHEVEMLTTFPYYPMWEKKAGDSWKLYRTDAVSGVRVHRCWHFVPRRPTGLKRILHEASFVISSTLRALMLDKADVMVVVSPPLLLGAGGWLVGRLKGMRHVLHIQDLQPDAAVGLGMLDWGWFIDVLRKLERFSYNKAARVSVISEGMLGTLKGRGIERLVYFPNWIRTKGKKMERGLFRRQMGIGEKEFVMLYSGNIGVKQGLDLVAEAAKRVADVQLLICGDGAARPAIEELIAARRMRNVKLLPLQPEEDYRQMMVDADVCVISQRPGSGASSFPSKLLSCVALGKPILAVADEDSELARVVREEGLGVSVAPEVEKIADVMRGLLQVNKERLEQWGRNGRGDVRRFEEGRVLGEFEGVLREVAGIAEPAAKARDLAA